MSRDPRNELAFEMAVSNVRFGPGVTRECGMDLADLGVRHALVLTDANVAPLAPVRTTLESLDAAGIKATVYDRVRVEPTDESFRDAIHFANRGAYDGFVAVGGGSTIDTAKAVNLYTTYPPEDFLDYANAPIGKALPVPGPLKPLIAIPTTAGTGSETTGVSIFDLTRIHAKTGIASRRLKPTLGLLDPDNTRTMPPQVAASSGLDILSHAVESFTQCQIDRRVPIGQRLTGYRGSNPISDIGRCNATNRRVIVRRLTIRATTARANMMLAAVRASGLEMQASICLWHVNPVSGTSRRRTPGYAIVSTDPHGFSVILNAPAVFRFTARANPTRHLLVAEALGADVSRARDEDAGKILADRITWFMQRLNTPSGLRSIGYSASDIPALVEGTMPQHRVTKLSPRPATPEDLARLFESAMQNW